MRPINRGAIPLHYTQSGRVQPVSTETYGYFMGQLIARIGEYCSFCEVAMGANLAIEHVLPKIVYPNAETDWNNFVLACTNCNSRKGTKAQSRAGYYWPDTSYTGFNTFSMLEYYLGQSGSDTVVLVKPRSGSGADEPTVLKTIDLFKLNNYVVASDPKQSDRRVWNRTRTWGIADSMANTLSLYYTQIRTCTGNDIAAALAAASDPAIMILKRQITMAALAAGFWSVWMTVFAAKTFINDTIKTALLQELFVAPFPGTRYP